MGKIARLTDIKMETKQSLLIDLKAVGTVGAGETAPQFSHQGNGNEQACPTGLSRGFEDNRHLALITLNRNHISRVVPYATLSPSKPQVGSRSNTRQDIEEALLSLQAPKTEARPPHQPHPG